MSLVIGAMPSPCLTARLAEAGTPLTDHRASSQYRTAMLRSSLLKFYAEHEEVLT